MWLDVATARGVTDAGRAVPARIGGRRTRPQLTDLLETALAAGAERALLTGPRPPSTWLLVRTPGWSPGAHYLDADMPVGRFTHDATGAKVELRRAAEWFGELVETPADARAAWELLAHVWGRAFRGGSLFDSPGATGMDGWVRSIANLYAPPPQLDDDTAALIRATSPQHRVELFPRAGELPGFWYLDGRFQYAALTRELGTGPAVPMTDRAAGDHFALDPYGRARYLVDATVPAGWDGPGVLMAPYGDSPHDGWHAPRLPGQTLTTWCDGAELRLLAAYGWRYTIREGLAFTAGRPLDTWTARILRARDAVDATLHPGASVPHADAVRGALRSILLHTIGGFHSTGRDVTRVIDNPIEYRGAGTVTERGDVWVVRERAELSGRNLAFRHPEWSSQVWARGHARILESPTGDRARWAGAAQLPLDHLVGIRGDALYLTEDPGWPDDGRVGRLRVKGHLHGPLPAPGSFSDLNDLRERAERNGGKCQTCAS